MNYQDFQQRLAAVKQMLGMIQVPADEQHIGIMGQIHHLLNSMNDECDNCLRQELMAQQQEVDAQ
jgi:hypothetical protein